MTGAYFTACPATCGWYAEVTINGRTFAAVAPTLRECAEKLRQKTTVDAFCLTRLATLRAAS